MAGGLTNNHAYFARSQNTCRVAAVTSSTCATQRSVRCPTPSKPLFLLLRLLAVLALTASSKLQHLDISKSSLLVGVWQHVFPAGRQLLELTSFNISCVHHLTAAPPRRFAAAANRFAAAPAGTCLAKCCPNLRSLDMRWLQCSAELLAPLQGLSGLHKLLSDSQVAQLRQSD
jgi:hypothetical protein